MIQCALMPLSVKAFNGKVDMGPEHITVPWGYSELLTGSFISTRNLPLIKPLL